MSRARFTRHSCGSQLSETIRLRHMAIMSLKCAICSRSSTCSWDAISLNSSGSSVAAALVHSSRIRSSVFMDRTNMPQTLDDICERFVCIKGTPRRWDRFLKERTRKGHSDTGTNALVLNKKVTSRLAALKYSVPCRSQKFFGYANAWLTPKFRRGAQKKTRGAGGLRGVEDDRPQNHPGQATLPCWSANVLTLNVRVQWSGSNSRETTASLRNTDWGVWAP